MNTQCFFFFQAEDGIRDLVRSRGLGDVYKRQAERLAGFVEHFPRQVISLGRRLGDLPRGERVGILSLIHI